ncbi:MAG TPA: polysaccharide biosynthesis C-terminal domain-containing protein [Ligilactobacillus acidipiscis]|uniref:Polysaccharide biosynthesis C-terminal domain-containing protein n=1 Tax=Ligilactobacillus acidipiscis TaxID=89059 RepID=A0A921F819_9LACO|nr:polysaccharide biosynthesis C-terminal domain-containing protein [Ligilactobacillus acidipiscis]
MKVIRNYLYNAGYQILALILPLITAPYVSRVLTKHGAGLNAYTNSIVQYFVLLGSIGIALYGNREIAYLRNDKHKMSKAFWEIQIIKTFAVIFATILYFVFLQFYQTNHILMIFQAINLLAAAFDISWFFMGIEDFKKTVVRNTLVKIISLILIFIFIKDSSDLGLYILILGGSLLVGNLTLWPPLKKYLVKINLSELRPLRHLRPTITLFIPQVATQVYLVLNKTMLGIMVSSDYSGFYNYADNIVKLVLALVTATGTVMLPHVANAFANGEKEKVNQYLYVSFDFVSFLAIAISFGLAAVGHNLGPYFYGDGYGPVGIAMMIEAPVVTLVGWSNVIGNQYLLPTRKTKEFSRSVIYGAIANIVINLPFIYFWGLNGAMIATVISEFVVTAYQLNTIKDVVNIKRLFINIPKYLLAGVIMFVPVFKMNIGIRTSVASLFFEVLVGIIIYFVMIFILKPTILKSGLRLVKKNKH